MEKLIFVLVLIVLTTCVESPLQFGELRESQLQFVPFGSDYYLKYKLDNQTANVNSLFCFTLMTYNEVTTDGTTSCSFQEITSQTSYKCVLLTDQATSTFFFSISEYNYRFQSQTKNGGTLTAANSGKVSIQSFEAQQLIRFGSGYFESSKFYHMISCQDFSTSSRECSTFWKQNYIHTYHDIYFKQNLLVQRNHVCQVYSGTFDSTNTDDLPFKYYINLFHGGAIRNGENFFFNAAVIVRDDTSGHYLNMWGGFCYSFDHFNRDGACFATQSGRIFDMISLLASGGYADTAANIGATDDIEVVTKSYREDTQNFKSYFTQYYRNYDTKDFFGDEKIIQKIYPTHTFVAYFDHEFNNVTLSCEDNQLKHQVVLQYSVDITLSSSVLKVLGLSMIAFIFL